MDDFEDRIVLKAIDWLRDPAATNENKIKEALKLLIKISNEAQESYNYNDYYGENDGYGIVGYSFDCIKCKKSNRFINDKYEEQTCKYCGEVNLMIVWEHD